MSSPGIKQQLPSRENTLFRSIVKYYETKQYKKGLKAADSILKKYPDHGETLAMRGLTLNCMGRKEEAYDHVRKGLKNDLKSHVCWHVYGLLYRSDRNYAEAIKCYRNAIRIDPQNLQILRDLYLLQIQMRDLKGFAETRRKLLTLKPNNRNNWIGFAIAHQLNGNLQMAVDIIDKYVSTLDADRPVTYEDSEMILYRNQLLEEMGDYAKALQHLEETKDLILDKIFWKQRKAEYLLALNKFDDARIIYDDLLEINPENFNYQRGLQCCFFKRSEFIHTQSGCMVPVDEIDISSIEQSVISSLLAYYDKNIKTAHPKVLVWRRLALSITKGKVFQQHVDEYLRIQLAKGIPSLGSDMKPFYNNACQEKLSIISNLLTSYLDSLNKNGDFPSLESDTLPNLSVDKKTLLWTMYFAAQHYDRTKEYSKALEYIEKCIQHTPDLLDFYQRKARILKHCGAIKTAAESMIVGRKLDLADRYINNKATEYLFHADRIEEADATIALFTRHEGDPQQNLYDMQCMWYELECAESYARQKQFGKALKKLFAVEKHFNDFQEDQFDFHTYCIRKMTLRAYVQMLKVEDNIFGHRFFKQAAKNIIQCYLFIYDNPQMSNNSENNIDLSKLTPAERKKAKRAQAKARKAEFKKKEEQEKERQQKEAEEKDQVRDNKRRQQRRETQVDTDPHGEELLKKEPLDEAWRFVTILQTYLPKDLSTHLHAFDVAIRRKKYLLCLQAVLRALKLTSWNTPQVFERIVIFMVQFNQINKTLNPVVSKIIQSKIDTLLNQQSDLISFVNAMKTFEDITNEQRFALAKSLYVMDKENKNEAINLIQCMNPSELSWKWCMKLYNYLLNDLKDSSSAKAYQTKIKKQFPLIESL